MPIHNQHFNPLNPNPNKHLICSTKTPQLCYKLESSSLRSICFLLGLWYLSWRPWWWESTVNRLSFYTELLLYKIIDSEKKKKKSLLGSFCGGVYRKNSSFFSKHGLHTEMQFHKLLNRQQPPILLQQWLPASIPSWPTGVEQWRGRKGDR